MTDFRSLTIERYKDTIFVALPAGVGVPINGACVCAYCKANPDKPPMWDTLVIGSKPPKNHYRSDTSWLCHYPELPR